MKILLVIDGIGKGGAERQLTELASGLKSLHHEVVIFIYRDLNFYKEEMETNLIPVKLISRKDGILNFIAKFCFEIKRYNPDYIISFKTIPSIWTLAASISMGYKNLITSERNTDIYKYDIKGFIFRILANRAKYVTCNSKTASELLVENYGIDKKRIKIIYNGVDIKRFSSNNYQSSVLKGFLKLNNNLINIGFVGRIEYQKNHKLAVLAINELIRKGFNIVLHCIGPVNDKNIFNEINKLIYQYSLSDNIYFYEPISDIEHFYKLMDFIILPSLYEGFPNVILEAMCSSKIVIASDVSDNRILIKDTINGFLFKNNDLEGLIDKLLYVLSLSTNEKECIGKNAYETIVKNYSKEKMVNNFLKIMV